MKIEFKNTFLDILRFNAAHQVRNIPLQVFYFSLFGLFFYYEYSKEGSGNSIIKALVISLVFYILMWLFQFAFNIFYLYSKDNKTILTTHIVEIQDESFYEETAFNRSYFYWSGISKIKTISGFIAVYVTPHSAVIIPKRVFSSKRSRDEFLNHLRNKIKNT